MTLAEFYAEVVRAQKVNHGWRWGQAMFNVLAAYFPELAEEVRGTPIDPFYLRGTNYGYEWHGFHEFLCRHLED